jgi:3-isopropylmalate/(R)-2-methylmalate dehydratase large subunit
MFAKIWDRNVVTEVADEALLYIDRCLIEEGSIHAFRTLTERGLKVWRPDQFVACADHYVPTGDRTGGIAAIGDSEIRAMVEAIEANTKAHRIRLFGMNDAAQGIVHIVGPEQGISQPGLVMTGNDSHASTHGALGALSFGIGWSELAHVMATQTLWQRRPKTMRIVVDGHLPFGVTAKDVIIAIIAKIGIGGASEHVIEYAGPAVRAMSVEQRLTLCNMSIEAGGRAGMVAPDDATYEYLQGRPYTPKAAMWDRAVAYWKTLPSASEATFDKDVSIDASQVAPMVTWGTNPEHAVPVTGRIPNPANASDSETRHMMTDALEYMDLKPGMSPIDIPIDRVFIGSCTNARIEDLRAAAEVAQRGHAVVPAWVVPGSRLVKRQAETEGLDRIFQQAGFEWREPGCSLCTAINGDILAPGERCASTSNRNFKGRQGPDGRTHLMSPAMAAGAALRGHIVDVRDLAEQF